MRDSLSPTTGRLHPLTMICGVVRVSRSTIYRTLAPALSAPTVVGKRGPKTRWSDAEVVAVTRAVLVTTPFRGEGYHKARARLAHRGLAVGGKRVLRLMWAHQLLAPHYRSASGISLPLTELGVPGPSRPPLMRPLPTNDNETLPAQLPDQVVDLLTLG